MHNQNWIIVTEISKTSIKYSELSIKYQEYH